MYSASATTLTASSKAIITSPVKIIREMEKARQRRTEKLKKFSQIYGVNRRTSPVIISARDPRLNHYLGQRYPDDGLLLATENWKLPKQDGDYFTIRPHPLVYSTDHRRSAWLKFDHLPEDYDDLSRPLLEALLSMGYARMSPIQRESFGPISRGRNALLTAECGSGKSIAYLAPIIDRLRKEIIDDDNPSPIGGSPRALILSPTRELNRQLFTVSEQIIDNLPTTDHRRSTVIDSAMISSDDVYAKILDRGGLDLLFATVGSAIRYRNMGALKFDRLRHLVIDEADLLLNESSIRDSLYELIRNLPFADDDRNRKIQLIFVASTYPDNFEELTKSLLLNDDDGKMRIQQISPHDGQRLHRLESCSVSPWSISHRFLRIARQFLPEALLSHVKQQQEDRKDRKRNRRPLRRCLIFTRDSATCEWIQHFLEQSGVDGILALHGSMNKEDRSESYDRLIQGDFLAAVGTEALVASGLDTGVHVDHVINYQTPLTCAGYLKRAGRVGGLGRLGSSYVTTFVTNRWEVDLVQELEMSVRLNTPIRNVHQIVKDRREFEE